MPTAASSSQANGRTSTAPWNQKKTPIPSDTAHNEAYSQPSWAGETEQLRFRNQEMFWSWTVAKRNTGFDTGDAQKSTRHCSLRSFPHRPAKLLTRRLSTGEQVAHVGQRHRALGRHPQ